MKRAIIAAALLLAGCGGDPEPVKPSPSPSPVKPLHLVTGDFAEDWNAEMADQPWVDSVISIDWLQGTPWLRIDVADSTSVEDVILICRTGLKFYADHTDGGGEVVWVYDSLGKVAQGASGTCRATQG